MNLLLQNTMRIPSGGWRYPRNIEHDGQKYGKPISDGQFITGGDFPELVYRVGEFRIINNIPLGDPEAEVNDWLCRNTGAKCSPAKPAAGFAKPPSGAAIVRFLAAMAKWFVSGDSVSQEEAERRAEICAGCRFNLPPADFSCFGCFGLFARIAAIIGERKTRMNESLRFCGHCGCSLPVVVFTPIALLDRTHANSDFPTDIGQGEQPCWRKVAA